MIHGRGRRLHGFRHAPMKRFEKFAMELLSDPCHVVNQKIFDYQEKTVSRFLEQCQISKFCLVWGMGFGKPMYPAIKQAKQSSVHETPKSSFSVWPLKLTPHLQDCTSHFYCPLRNHWSICLPVHCVLKCAVGPVSRQDFGIQQFRCQGKGPSDCNGSFMNLWDVSLGFMKFNQHLIVGFPLLPFENCNFGVIRGASEQVAL